MMTKSKNTRVRGFAPWNPSKKSLERVIQVQAILDEYRKYLPVTVRQVFYRMVGAHDYGKTETAYANLGETINRARRARLIPFDAIRDDGLTRINPPYFSGVQSFFRAVNNAVDDYRLDRQTGQPVRLFVFCEAVGMTRMLADAVGEYGIPVLSSGGFDSTTVKHDFAMELSEYDRTEILHIGDLDPSGESIHIALHEDLIAFCEGHGAASVPTFTRIAVTREQAIEMDLPTAPPKKTDNRKFEGETVQAEAIPPDVLIRIVLRAVTDRQDEEIRQGVLESETQDRAKIRKILEALE